MAKHNRIGGKDNKPPRISYLTHSPNRSMPPEIMSIDESDTLLEEGHEVGMVGEFMSERRDRRKNGSHMQETAINRRLVNPAVTIVEMTTPISDKVQIPLLTPLEGTSPSTFGENNTNVNSTGNEPQILSFTQTCIALIYCHDNKHHVLLCIRCNVNHFAVDSYLFHYICRSTTVDG